jgi:hypothetical protein
MLVKVEEAVENYVQENMAAPRVGYAHLGWLSKSEMSNGRVEQTQVALEDKRCLVADIVEENMWPEKEKEEILIYRRCNCSQKFSSSY